MNTRPLLQLRNISKDEGPFFSLRHIDFDISPGEIHALVGEHGSGKTTLGRIISGGTNPTKGNIVWDGLEYRALTIPRAKNIGIEMVPQDISLLEDLSIAENFFILVKSKIRRFIYQEKKLHREIQEFLNNYHIPLNVATPVHRLTLPEKTFIDILRYVYCNPRLLILDEVMAKLSPAHYKLIQRVILTRTQQRCSTILITHRIDDLFEYVDRVTILRNGEIMMTDAIHNIDKVNLIRFAYTQTRKLSSQPSSNVEFYQFLKYNQAILEDLPVNLVITDTEFNVKLVNECAKTYFHLESSPEDPLTLQQLFPKSDAHLSSLLYALNQPEQETLFDIPVYVQRQKRINNILTYPIFDGSDKIGHILIFDDITEQQKMREQIILAEKLASIGMLAAGVAHEINHPLGIINNILDYLQIKLVDPETLAELESIKEEVFSVSQIIGNLVTFSSNDRQEKELFDINESIQNILHLIKHHSRQKHYNIFFKSDEPEIEIFSNRTEIKQVLLNLLKNAFEAMTPGGTLTIHTTYWSDKGNKNVKIIVEDNGEGIKADNLHDIFLPFYSTKKDTGKNLGLGLFMCYSLIEKHNGTIAAEEVSPHGTRFIITFPSFVRSKSMSF